MVNEIIGRAQHCPETFDEKQLFASPESRVSFFVCVCARTYILLVDGVVKK